MSLSDSKSQNIVIESAEERELLVGLAKRTDAEALRIKRYLAMPDLSRTLGSPIKELVDRALKAQILINFDDVKFPEILDLSIAFDLFDYPPNHPVRSRSDTYYPDDNHILRTMTTNMWYYYVNQPDIKTKLDQGLAVGSVSYGKVYRKDEIDRHHMNVFHQLDGWFIVPKTERVIMSDDLQKVLIDVAHALFGSDIKYRFNSDTFPYTDPSLEMEVEINGRWIEVLGCGIVKEKVLDNLGVKGYNGWAFGFGLERLAIVSMDLPDIRLLWSQDPRVTKQLKLGQKYVEVSKSPPITRDISFVVSSDFVPNNYFDLIRDLGGDLVEQVELLDKYENAEKFGEGKTSYTYRIIYRSNERTLTTEEIDPIQDKIYSETESQFNAELR